MYMPFAAHTNVVVSKEVLQSLTQRSSSLFLFGQVTSEVTLSTINPSYLLLLLALLEVRDYMFLMFV